tara:strand:+ start:124 stop:600 length:477 start_codon:yes stop_codon:yes gene_type:complete
MLLLSIDPGSEQSGWVVYDSAYDPRTGCVVAAGISPNAELLERVRGGGADQLVVEMIASYGMPVGREVFDTCVWIGRFWEAFPGERDRVYRKDVKMCVCSDPRAKDSNVRQALIDMFGPGRSRAIGTKGEPGPLYGFKRDMWAALAVAVTWIEAGNGG